MLVTNNAYHVLWLSSDNDEKQINKRYKEILNLLSIDETPSYNSDVPFVDYKKLRKESNIKEALHRLNNQKKSLYEFFFWFNIVDKEDEKCLKLYAKWEYAEAINKWYNLYEESRKSHYIKNAVIANLLLYENLKQFDDLDFSDDPKFITKWLYRVINSDKFWKEFEVMYNMNNTIPLSASLLKEFRSELPQFLAEAFFDIWEEVGTNRLYRIFSKKFEVVAQELDDNKNVTTPIKKIEQYMEDIRNADKKENLKLVFDRIEKIQKYVERLDKLWLSENARIIKLKDDAAGTILAAAIDINNDYEDYENGLKLVNLAETVVASENIRIRIEKNKEVFESNLDFKKNKRMTITNDKWEKETVKFWTKPSILWTVNWCWTTIYWDTLYLVILFIPILPISRWMCESPDWTHYTFYWKVKLKKWQQIWQWIGLWIIAVLIVIWMVNW